MLAWPMVISVLEFSITGRWEHFCACQEGPFQSLSPGGGGGGEGGGEGGRGGGGSLLGVKPC